MKTLKQSRLNGIIAKILVFLFLANIIPMNVLAAELANTAAVESTSPVKAEGKIVGEVQDKRDAHTKVFMKDDKTFEAAVYNEAVHYLNNGTWKDIDNSLQAATDEDNQSVAENKANSFNVKIAKKADANKLVRIIKDKYELSWSIQGNGGDGIAKAKDLTQYNSLSDNDKAKTLLNNSSVVDFKNAFTNTDLQYNVTGSRVKENIIINSKTDNPEYKFNINTKNLIPKLQDDKSIVFFDTADSKSAVFKMTSPFMYDANGEISKDVNITLAEDMSGYTLTVTPDNNWLNESGRTFPVTIDPPVETSLDVNSIFDSFVGSGVPNNNYYNAVVLGVGNESVSGTTRSYVKFTLPALNTGDIIFSAKYYSCLYTANSNVRQINVHKVSGDWQSSTITWNNAPGYNSKVEDYEQVSGAAGAQFSWDITSIAKDWYSTGSNYGLMLKNNDESVGYNEFFSSDTSGDYAGYRPTAVLDFVNNTGLESYCTYNSQDIGRAGTGNVNDFNGNLVFTHDDFSMSGNKMPVAINHVFNSNDKGSNINFGKGWRLNLSQTLTQTTLFFNGNNVNYFKYIDEDGTSKYFQDGTSPIKEEYGGDLTLIKNGDGSFTIKDKKDNKLNFNSSGTLVNIKDNNNNTLTLNYISGKLTSVTDGAGRITTLNYNASGYLSEIVAPDTVTKTTYSYTGDQLTSIGYIDGKTSTYTYDGNANMTSAANYTGYKMTYGYYGAAPYRISSISESGTGLTGNQLNVSYGFNSTTYTDTKNKQNVYQFDNMGKTLCIKDAEGNAKYYKYGDTNNSKKLTTESKLQKTVKNIAANPSGEYDRDWAITSDGGLGSGGFTTVDKHYGSRSFKVAKTDYVSRQYMNSVVSVEKGKTYTLSAYVKTVNISNANGKGAGLSAHYLNSSGVYQNVYSNYISGTNDWQRIQLTFTLPADGIEQKAIIRMQLDSETGTAYFDDVQLEEGSVANRQNLIENGDFSGTGTVPTGWWNTNLGTGEGLTTTTDTNHPQCLDSNVLKTNGVYGVNKGIGTSVFLSGSVGDTFDLSAWAKGDSVPSGSFDVRAAFIPASGGASWVSLHFNRDSSDWQYLNDVVKAPIAYVRIDIYVAYENNANTAYFDGVQFYKEEFGDSYSYDSNGNLTSNSDIAKNNSSFAYNGSNNLISSTDPKGNSFAYEYDGNHNITKATSAENVVYSFTYDSSGNPLTSKIGDATTYINSSANYTANGNYISSMTDSSGNTVNYNYDSTKGNLSNMTDANGKTTSYGYDNMNRMTSVSKTADGQAVTNSYNYSNDRISQITHNGFSYNFGYDSLGNNTTMAAGSQNLITNNYETITSKLLDSNYGNGQKMSILYDGNDNAIGKVYSGDNTQGIAYSGNIQNVGMTTVSGNGAMLGIEYLRLESLAVSLTNIPAGMHIKYQAHVQDIGWQNWVYDGATAGTVGQSKRMEAVCIKLEGAPAGYTVQYQVLVQNIGWMDPVQDGQVAGTTGQSLRIEAIKITVVKQRASYKSDANTNLGYKEDYVNGINYKYSYDLSNRPTRIDESNGNYLTYGYDQNSNMNSMTEKVNGNSYITNYAFDKDGKPTTTTYNRASSNTVTQSYDSLGRVTGKTVNTGTANYNTSFGYVAGANGSKTTKVGSITNNGAAISYTYDSNGNISTITQNSQTISFQYNELNEVKRENNQVLNKTITYSYDAGGNILSKVEYPYTTGTLGTATSTINYSYGDSNWKDKLTSYNGQAITYDAIGNPLTNNGWTYSWEEGRQLSGMSGNGNTISYKYNDSGTRTSKTVNGVTTNYHLMGDNVTYESNGSDSIYYTYDSAGQLVSMDLNGVEYYYVRNAQGDIIGLFDNTATQVVSYTYNTWGKLISTTGTLASTVGVKNQYRYRGYRYDTETNLYYLQSRYYNPDWGRFVNADGNVGKTGELLSANMFAYCGNNPINRIDPNGTSWFSAFVAVVAVAVVVTIAVLASPVIAIAATIAVVVVAAAAIYVDQNVPDKETHYNRNQYNTDIPLRSEKVPADWSGPGHAKKGPPANCHQSSAPKKDNVKYVSPDGKKEGIYNSKGSLVIDPRDIGTYNFANPNTDWVGHTIKDIIPWIIHGNSKEDTTLPWDRFKGMIGV